LAELGIDKVINLNATIEDDQDKTFAVRHAKDTLEGTVAATTPPAEEKPASGLSAPGKLTGFSKPEAPAPTSPSVSSMSGGFNGWHVASSLENPFQPKPVHIDIPAPTVDSIPRRESKLPFGKDKK